jgi:hypothetical protein
MTKGYSSCAILLEPKLPSLPRLSPPGEDISGQHIIPGPPQNQFAE